MRYLALAMLLSSLSSSAIHADGVADDEAWTRFMTAGARQMAAAAFADAEKSFLSAVEAAKVYAGDDIRPAKTFNNLGALYHQTGRYDEAERNYQLAVEIYRKQPETAGVSLAAVTNNLGELNRLRGRFTEA